MSARSSRTPASPCAAGYLPRLGILLAYIPWSPWWWRARRQERERQGWIRHLRRYDSSGDTPAR